VISATEAEGTFRITGHTPAAIDEELNTACEAAREHAVREGRNGLLVTRHGPDLYTVAVSSNVPYGQTREHDRWE